MKFTDARYLRDEQYRDDSNLRARIELHRRFSTNPQPWHRWVFEQLAFPADADILEVGCGPAELWVQNLERIPDGWRLTLADLSEGMVERARTALGDRADYRVADIQELRFADDSFDGVIANHMLYHVPDRPRAYREVARVLRPGGLFYATTNGTEHLKELKALFERQEEWQFRMEDAGEELRSTFGDVQLTEFPDSLEVTEVEPVLAFIRSMDSGEVAGAEQVVRDAIERDGAFRVTKAAGIFCSKP